MGGRGVNFLHLNQRNQRNQILFQYLRDKKKKRKKGAQKKGGENSPISPPLDPCLPFLEFALTYFRVGMDILELHIIYMKLYNGQLCLCQRMVRYFACVAKSMFLQIAKIGQYSEFLIQNIPF